MHSPASLHRQMCISQSSGSGLPTSDQTACTEQRQGQCLELEQDPVGLECVWLFDGKFFFFHFGHKILYHRWRITPQDVLLAGHPGSSLPVIMAFDLLWTFYC